MCCGGAFKGGGGGCATEFVQLFHFLPGSIIEVVLLQMMMVIIKSGRECRIPDCGVSNEFVITSRVGVLGFL